MRRAKSVDANIERNLELTERNEPLLPRALSRSNPRRFRRPHPRTSVNDHLLFAPQTLRKSGARTRFALEQAFSGDHFPLEAIQTALAPTGSVASERQFPFSELDFRLLSHVELTTENQSTALGSPGNPRESALLDTTDLQDVDMSITAMVPACDTVVKSVAILIEKIEAMDRFLAQLTAILSSVDRRVTSTDEKTTTLKEQ